MECWWILGFDYLTFILIFELSTFFSIYLLNPLLKNYNLIALYSSEFYGFCKNMSIWKLWIFWFLDWRWRKKLMKMGNYSCLWFENSRYDDECLWSVCINVQISFFVICNCTCSRICELFCIRGAYIISCLCFFIFKSVRSVLCLWICCEWASWFCLILISIGAKSTICWWRKQYGVREGLYFVYRWRALKIRFTWALNSSGHTSFAQNCIGLLIFSLWYLIGSWEMYIFIENGKSLKFCNLFGA